MVNSPTDGLSDEERLLRQAIDDAFVQCITRLMANWRIDIWQEAIRAIETGEI